MALIQLSYISIAAYEMSDADLDQIVASATRRNAENGITGMLLYADGRFMQLLEGEDAVVEATFARVSLDPRHHDVVVTERAAIEARSFSNWSMGFKRIAATDMRTLTATPPPAAQTGGTTAPRLADAILQELTRAAH